jgi:hypothetical protein
VLYRSIHPRIVGNAGLFKNRAPNRITAQWLFSDSQKNQDAQKRLSVRRKIA